MLDGQRNKMTLSRDKYVQVVRFVRRLRGKSQPILVEGIDGNLYVLKFGNNPQGPNVSFNEAAGSALYRGCRLSVPSWERLYVSKSFLDRNRGCWLVGPHGRKRPEPGLCFGTRFIMQRHAKVYEILPASYYARVQNRQSFWLAWILDVCCGHTSHREAIFVQKRGKILEAVFIDSGDILGGPRGSEDLVPWESPYCDVRIYPEIHDDELKAPLRVLESLDGDGLRSQMRTLPLEWQTESAVARFERALNFIHAPLRLEALVERLFQSGGIPERIAPASSEGKNSFRPLHLNP